MELRMQACIVLLTTILFSVGLFAQPDPKIPVEKGPNGEIIHKIVDVMPRFTGCEEMDLPPRLKNACSKDELVKFISEHLTYPEEAKEKGIQGMVLVSFVINEKGEILRPEVKRDIGGGCGMEALRVIGLMPKWVPGQHEGKSVSVRFNLPVNFRLAEVEETKEKPEYKLFWGGAHQDEINVKDVEKLSTQRIYIRDLYGKNYSINELEMVYERGAKYKELSSRGDVSEQMSKHIKRAGKNTIITFKALIQAEDQFMTIEREFRVK